MNRGVLIGARAVLLAGPTALAFFSGGYFDEPRVWAGLVAWLVAIVGNNALSGAARSADAGSWTATERLAKTASRWQPWSAEPVYLLGEAQLARGDRADAHRSFERALAHDPRDWRTWYELARTTTGSKHDNAVSAIAWLNPMAVRLVP